MQNRPEKALVEMLEEDDKSSQELYEELTGEKLEGGLIEQVSS